MDYWIDTETETARGREGNRQAERAEEQGWGWG